MARRLACGYTAALMIAMCVPVPQVEPGAGLAPLDKLVHAAAFALLAALWSLALRPHSRALPRVIIIVAAIALCTELLQLCLPYRGGDARDFVADLVGGASYLAAAGARRLACPAAKRTDREAATQRR